MVRRFTADPVDPAAVDRMLRHAVRAPSAGFSQGWAFLVLDTPDDVELFWSATMPRPDARNEWLDGMRTAPVLIVPMSSRETYLDRYAEPDKGWTDRDEARWPVPFWHLDAAMASLLILLTVVDEDLGACFFGVPPEALEPLRAAFGIPDDHLPVGAIAIGHPAAGGAPGSAVRRRRRPVEEVVHHGRWRGRSAATAAREATEG